MRSSLFSAMLVLTLLVPMVARGQLYTEDFDADHSANWLLSANEGFGTSPSDGLGDPDASADFFFDYSTVGIPSAPHSTGGSTRGMKIQANLIAGIFGGASASPVGQSFTGDYKLNVDVWGNYVGDPTLGVDPGGNGQTMMTTYGILTDGATGVVPGVADAVWFGATVDGGSGADFRAYSIERTISYQVPPDATVLDGVGQPVDGHANYLAGSRNNTASLYADNFGGATVPAAQTNLFAEQFGTTPAGSTGMAWHDVEISKVGNLVTWKIDGVELITLDMTNFTTQPDGNNIFLGHSDINAGSSAEPDRFDLEFALYDNVKVEAIVGVPGDYNNNGTVDAADYVLYRKGIAPLTNEVAGVTPGTTTPEDYDAWRARFGNPPGSGSLADGAAVPEPQTIAFVMIGLLLGGIGRRRK